MKKTSTGKFWAAVPVVLLGTLTGGLGIVAYVATRDPSFAIERDYYKKAVDYDQLRAQDETNEKLGWRLDVKARTAGSTIQLDAKVDDAHGKAVKDAEIQVEAFPISRSANVTTTRFASGTAQLPLVTTGLWELRFTVDAHEKRFTQTVRRDIGRGP
jgi:hypothetical protein